MMIMMIYVRQFWCMDNLILYVSQPKHLHDSLKVVGKVLNDINMRFGLSRIQGENKQKMKTLK